MLTSIVSRSWRQKGEAEVVLEFITKHDYVIHHEKVTGETEAFLISAANCFFFPFNLHSPSSDKWIWFHLKELERTIAQLLNNKECINFTLFTQWIEATDVKYI